MVVQADEEVEREWKEQTRQNSRLIVRKTEAIADIQKTVLEVISDTSLTEKQRKTLKGSYEELMKDAEMEAKEVKRERDEFT